MAGQTFMQYAYSWGAAVVILGTLFKLTHLPGANLMLFIGMGTEVFVFLLSGFERVTAKADEPAEAVHTAAQEIPQMVGGVVTPITNMDPEALAHGAALSAAAANLASAGQAAAEAQRALSQLKGGSVQVDAEAVNATDPAAVQEAITNYAEELTRLTEAFARIRTQAEHLTTDSEEMDKLNRAITGIATVYELQLRSVSKQVNTIDEIDARTKEMAAHIEELNTVYARMIQAMTVNMPKNV